MSSSRSLKKKEPPKKSKKGLVIGIVIASSVVLITIIVIVVIVLLRRRRTTPPTPTAPRTTPPTPAPTPTPEEPECEVTADCDAGQVCNTAEGTCVECLADLDCPSGRPTCNTVNNTCVPLECQNDGECTAPEAPFCISNECLECQNNGDCSGNTIYSSVNKNFCDTDNTCTECLVDGDCGVGECQSGVCCNLTPPTVATVNQGGVNSNITISGGYTTVQPLVAGDEVIVSVYDAANNLIFEKPPIPADGFYSFTQNSSLSAMSYKVGVELLRACGDTASSPLLSFTPVNSAPSSTGFLFPPTVSGNTGSTVNFNLSISTQGPWVNDPRIGIIARKNTPFEPSPRDIALNNVIQRNLTPTFTFFNSGFNANTYTLATTWPAVFGETWYYYMWIEASASNGNTVSRFHYGSYTIQ